MLSGTVSFAVSVCAWVSMLHRFSSMAEPVMCMETGTPATWQGPELRFAMSRVSLHILSSSRH